QFRRDSPASIARPLQGDFLNFIPQIHVQARGLYRIQRAVVATATETRHLAHPNHTQPGSGLHFFLDLLVEGAPLFRARSRRCSSTCCKARFKKSISMDCWPILRSNSATLVSSARFFPAPRNALAP